MSSAVPTEARHNIIIDTDVGSDDALAIACALTEDPAVLKVCAITTLFGNMPNEQVATNVATILKVFGKADIPFYSGSSSPLASQQLPEPWLGHGSNGLGGSEFSAEIAAAVGAGGDVSLPRRSPEPAVHALIRMARERPGFYEILAIGPLTNLALACKIDPDFPKNIKRLVWMGGSASGKGNATLCAEFNAHADADAAAVVFAAWPTGRLVMVPWELCDAAAVPWDLYHKLSAAPSLLSRFMKKACLAYETLGTGTVQPNEYLAPDAPLPRYADLVNHDGSFYQESEHKKTDDGCEVGHVNDPHRYIRKLPFAPADVYALFVLLHEEHVVRTKDAHCVVETAGTFTRGFIAVDWFHTKSELSQVRIARNVDSTAFLGYLSKMVGIPHVAPMISKDAQP